MFGINFKAEKRQNWAKHKLSSSDIVSVAINFKAVAKKGESLLVCVAINFKAEKGKNRGQE